MPNPTPPTPSAAGEELAGLVEHVTFHSEDTGFTVLKVKARGHRELVAVVATAAEISPGEWIEARGGWRVDPRHGRQFDAREVVVRPPDSLEGIESYLGSGLIKGIGPLYAQKLVAGLRQGRVRCDRKPLRRAGAGRRASAADAARQIKDAWKEQKTVREIMTFLFSHGVSTARAFRIYKTYGEEAIATVQHGSLLPGARYPRHRVQDRRPDRGTARGSRRNPTCGPAPEWTYVLLELTNEGHCAYPRERAAVARTANMLDIPLATS